MLIDADETSWSSWNRYAHQMAAATGARPVSTSDGGITGPAFFDHVRRIGRPVVNCPKGQTTPVPPDLLARPIEEPVPCWTWSLVSRRHERRPVVRRRRSALAARRRSS